MWNKSNGDFVFNLRADAILLAEVHLKKDRTHELLADAGRLGWSATIGPARQSANSTTGSNAGVAACIHGRWQDLAWPDCVDHRGRVGPYSDLVGRSVRLDGLDLQIMSAYFDCHDGVLGRNLSLLEKVEYRTGAGRDPFILAADVNLSPDVFAAQAGDWLTRNRAVIARPRNVPITCRAGNPGTLLDYFIISESLAGMVRAVETDISVPWWPHYGVWLRLDCRPTAVLARQRVQYRLKLPGNIPASASGPPNADDDSMGDLTDLQRKRRLFADKDNLWRIAVEEASKHAPRSRTPCQ